MKEIIIEVPDRFGQELEPYKGEIKGGLVRCKDCTHREHCEIVDGFGKSAEWFCADGERLEAND